MDDPKTSPHKDPSDGNREPESPSQDEQIAIEEPVEPGDPDSQPV